MKKLIIVFVILFAGLFKSETNAWNTNVDFNFFYHNLNPYGEWIQVDYDLVVWKPYNINRGWSPYSAGHWEYTSYGWYWDSYEPFGWATYHYGRWYYDDYYEWVWVPGYEWGPSWVEWRYSDSYIGWAPLPPYADFRVSIGIHFSMNYRSSYHYWNFVSYNRFCHRNVNTYFVNTVNKNYIFNNTKYRTNYYSDRGRIINGGVDRNYVERRAGSRITEREVARTSNLRDYTGSRGNANTNRIVSYRPSEREVQNSRNSAVNIEKHASSKSNLQRDIVTFRNEESKSRGVESSRNNDAVRNRNSIETPKVRNKVNSGRVYREDDKSKSSSRYQTQSNTSKKQTSSYRNPVSNSKVNKSVRESTSRSTSKKSSSINRSRTSTKPSVSKSNRSSSNKSYRSNSSSRTSSSKSSRSSSSKKGKRR